MITAQNLDMGKYIMLEGVTRGFCIFSDQGRTLMLSP
jgi:hypothetical protein